MMFSDVSIDDVAQYWDRRPCNLTHSNARVGTHSYFEEVRYRKYKVEPHIPGFAQFERWAGKRVLEIGCGIGTDTIEFALAGAEVVAVDVSAESLALARLRAYEYGVEDRCSFIHADAEHLTLSALPLRYDLVYSFGALHHTPRPWRAFREIARTIQPSTCVKFMLYNRLSWKAISLTHGRVWDNEAIARQSEAQTACPVTYTYTLRDIRPALSPWFHVDAVRAAHIFPYKLDKYLHYEYEKEWWARLPGFDQLERVLGWHLLIDAHRGDIT